MRFVQKLGQGIWMRCFIALLTIAAAVPIAAQQRPDAPIIEHLDLHGEMGLEGGFIALMIANDYPDDIQFNLYTRLLDGDDSDFVHTKAEYMETVSEKGSSTNEIVHIFLPMIEEEGVYEFYITAVSADGAESEPSDILEQYLMNIHEEYPRYSWDFQDPNAGKGRIGEEYTFILRAYDTDGQTEIEIEMTDGPDGATYENTLVNYTPSEGGIYRFEFRAKDQTAYPDLVFQYEIYVSSCTDMPEITFTIEDENGIPYQYGYIEIIGISGSASGEIHEDHFKHYSGYEFQNGEVVISELDEGKYYYYLWAEGAKNKEYGEAYVDDTGEIIIRGGDGESSTFEVKCGEDQTISIVLDRAYSTETFTVSGRVEMEDTAEPIEYARVYAIGSNDDSNGPRYYFHAVTDQNGEFTIDLPVDLEYYVVAEHHIFDHDGAMYESFMREYWNEAATMLDADIIGRNFVGDMVFTLALPTPFANSISGNVSTEDGGDLPQTDIFAFMVEIEEGFAEEYYYGLYEGYPVTTDEDGNYELTNLVPGKYVVMAMPMDDSYMPAFYGMDESTMHWDESDYLEVGSETNLSGIDIILLKTGKGSGSGIIRGYVDAKGDAKGGLIKQEAGGMHGVTVYATNIETGDVFGDMTDSDGYYEITSLPVGTYAITADRVGYNPDNREVTIGEGEEGTADADMTITSKTTSVDELFMSSSSVFPNPTNGQIAVKVDENLINATATLTDVSGKVINTIDIMTLSAGEDIDFDLSGESSGTYLITITSGNLTRTWTIVRQ